ncbi:hypothetical protein [Actinoplanes derwentensis]|uniref:Thiol-disulfide isomerase or thioredoxin n=1 Tax=Actinoplanes derwentensis TaxID=113562 RepID=A0A1H1R544_9ACTN|nr:hypothetical protein [Actinoplanes derwentensis]GID87999.1 hypothetical protein Ade03nite_69230 [Actinoplanes derwentensis]SDS30049.1 Thiol-disulfide isomerase or thioredoxin [Actinoplanes derwentensis]
MIFIVAALVLVGLLGVLNLALSIGIIRRLREQQDQEPRQTGRPDPVLPPGAIAGPFTATTVDGEPAGTSPALVGFFSPGCGSCAELLPAFTSYAARTPGGRERVLAVISGPEEMATEYLDALAPVAQVVLASPGAPVLAAFQTKAYPAVYLLGDDRRVLFSGGRIDDFPAQVPALPTLPAALQPSIGDLQPSAGA